MKTPKRETRLNRTDRKKKRKKNENRTRGDRRAPDASPSSWTGCLLSFPFESCSFFYELTPRERVPFSNASRVSRKSSVLRRARNNNNNNNNTGHASTRASFVVGKSSSRGSARRTKRKSENFSRVREEETEIQTKKVHAYALEETRNQREIQINTREAWKKTKNSSNSSRDTHRTAHTDTHTQRERERGTDNAQREIE